MNATFDGNWNTTMDVSNVGATQEHSIQNFDATKQTIPVEIKDLCELKGGVDKVNIGRYDFSKIVIVGKIVNVEEDKGGIVYVLADMEDSSYSIRCCVYNTSSAFALRYVEGSIVRVRGKLHYHDDQLEIVVLTIYEIEDSAEIDVFKWGARLTKIEFESDLLGTLYNNPSAFNGIRGYNISTGIKGEEVTTVGSVEGNSLSLGERIIKYLRDSGQEKFNVDEMAENLNVPVDQVQRAVETLEHEGNVFVDGDGCYGLGC